VEALFMNATHAIHRASDFLFGRFTVRANTVKPFCFWHGREFSTIREHYRILSFLLVGVAFASLLGCDIQIPNSGSAKVVRGNGVVVTEERVVEDFNSIEVPGAIQVNISYDSEPALSITGEENLLAIIDTPCEDGRLVIRTTESYSSSKPIVINAKCSKLQSYHGHGASQGTVAEVDAESFDVELSGASSLEIQSGKVDFLKGSASGASTLRAGQLEARKADVEASGASNIIVRVSDELTANASGASNIDYSGSPGIVNKNTSGASSISPRNE
jgi:hypothetical protein